MNNISNFILFCWNIGNPSVERAGRQALWLRKQAADVLVLTECKRSEGCLFLERYFLAYGYHVIFRKPEGSEYGVLIASKRRIEATGFAAQVNYLCSRVLSVAVDVRNLAQGVEIIGLYVPSRDSSSEKIQRKKQFLKEVLSALECFPSFSHRIFCGDLNILEPDHIPHYSFFESWEYSFYTALPKYKLRDAFRYFNANGQEYSWVGRTGDGYRYDHCFVSDDLLPFLQTCYYLHEPRIEKLSDHSALITVFRSRDLETDGG